MTARGICTAFEYRVITMNMGNVMVVVAILNVVIMTCGDADDGGGDDD